jgi:hypothetical protein
VSDLGGDDARDRRRRSEGDRQENDREEVAGQEINRQEVDRQEVDRQEVDRQEVDRQEVDREEVDRQVATEQTGHEGPALETVVESRDRHSPDDKPVDFVAAGWGRFDYYTEKASELARKLSLLGFAAIVFVTGITNEDFALGDAVDLPARVITAGTLLAISLTIDLFHYVTGSVVWFAWPRWHEYRQDRSKRRGEAYKPPTGYPGWLPWFSNVMFLAKISAAGVGWVFLLIEISYSVK